MFYASVGTLDGLFLVKSCTILAKLNSLQHTTVTCDFLFSALLSR